MTKAKIITAATIAYLVVLTTLCLVPISAPTPNLQVIGFDKLVHIGLYLGLNTLLISTTIAHRGGIKVCEIVTTTLAAIIYGVVIEFVQQAVGRDFDIYDIAANSIGAIAVVVVVRIQKVMDLLKGYLLGRS